MRLPHSKMLCSTFSVRHLLLVMQPTLKSSEFSQLDSHGENKFSFSSDYQLATASWLGLRTCIPFSFQLENPVWCRAMQAPHLPSHSLWVNMWVAPAVLRRHCFLNILHPLWLLHSLCIFQRVHWALMKGIWWRQPLLELSVLRSLLLHNLWVWVSVFIPICCRNTLLCLWLIKALFRQSSNLPKGKILLPMTYPIEG